MFRFVSKTKSMRWYIFSTRASTNTLVSTMTSGESERLWRKRRFEVGISSLYCEKSACSTPASRLRAVMENFVEFWARSRYIRPSNAPSSAAFFAIS